MERTSELTAVTVREYDDFGSSVSIDGDTAVDWCSLMMTMARKSGSAIFSLICTSSRTSAVITGDTSATHNKGHQPSGHLSHGCRRSNRWYLLFTWQRTASWPKQSINASSGFWFYFAAPAFMQAQTLLQ